MTQPLPQTLDCAGYEIYRRQNYNMSVLVLTIALEHVAALRQ